MDTDTAVAEHAAADPPSRATVGLTITLGLLPIPCLLYSGLEGPPNPVERHNYSKAGNRAGKIDYDVVTGKQLTEIVKKAEVDGKLVELSNDEVAAVYEQYGVTSGEILSFVPLAAVFDGTYVIDAINQIRPAPLVKGTGKKAKKFPNPAANKAFNVLMQGMAARGVAALIKIVQRTGSVPRYAAVLPDGRLLTLCFATQVRKPREMPAEVATEAEVAVVCSLIDAVGVDTPPLYSAEGRAVIEYLEAKAAGTVETAKPSEESTEAPVVDLMAALTASVAAMEKAA